jgi:hypothetical protein
MKTKNSNWPHLSFGRDQDTYNTFHLWLQIAGKVRLAQMPWINHSWHVPLYVTGRGFTTSIIPYDEYVFEIEFDLSSHRLEISTSRGERHSFPLESMSVAAFYRRIIRTLGDLDIQAPIWPIPVEIPDPIQPFHENEAQTAYNPEAIGRLWQAMLKAHRVFTDFRAGFIGKASPVHLFWGAFDLAVTRFSGRTAPKHPGGAPNCADWVMQEAYSHEVSSAGFWPGQGLGEAAFYAYAYPEPNGFKDYPVRPKSAYYHKGLGEFILPYEAVMAADDPESYLLDFLQSSYEAAADLAAWDRGALERRTHLIVRE